MDTLSRTPATIASIFSFVCKHHERITGALTCLNRVIFNNGPTAG